jgi:YidC/Oxa1 family membrane protein insertase
MENRRFILLAVLGVLIFFIYQAWQTEHGPKPELTPPDTVATQATLAESARNDSDVPTVGVPDAATTTPGDAAPAPVKNTRIEVRTDLYVGEITSLGGDLRRLELIGYPLSKKQPEKNVPLFNDRDGHFYVLQSGVAGSDKALGSHLDDFTSAQAEYKMADDADTLDVPLERTDAAGNEVVKTYRFHRGSYEIELIQQVVNGSAEPLTASPYVRIVRTPVPVAEEPRFVHTYTGFGVYEAKPGSDAFRFKKHSFKDLDKESYSVDQTGGWIAMLQHYFVAAILPPLDQKNHFEGKPGRDQRYVAQYLGAVATIAPQATQTFTTKLYVGPKLQDSIGKAAKGLELTVDYGFLTAISEPLFWLMEKLHHYTGNWGVAIILLTIIVKGAFYPLSAAQYRSAAKMRKFAPRIADLKERYAGDRERMSKAMMELYKKEGFNPLAGCWPLLVQMPVFFALYWVFLESVELRQADFALWINDLTSPDPFFVLPVIYGISMFFMQRLSGQSATMDPMQQKMMNVMPIALTGFFAFFPAGLVLYWCVSNTISISQQYYVTRKIAREDQLKLKTSK